MSKPSIATRKGDDGSTSLLYGQRVPKSHPQIETVGTLDELNVALGAIKPQLSSEAQPTRELIETLQKNLIALMGEIACDESDLTRYEKSQFERIADADLARIDQQIVALESQEISFEGWTTPGANALAAAFDTARTTARRAERQLVALSATGRHPRALLRRFLNRLSDLLWLLAREAENSV